MKVSGLIEALKKMPQDYEVVDCCDDRIAHLWVYDKDKTVNLQTEGDVEELDEPECSADTDDIARAENEGLPPHPVVVGAEAVFTLDKE